MGNNRTTLIGPYIINAGIYYTLGEASGRSRRNSPCLELANAQYAVSKQPIVLRPCASVCWVIGKISSETVFNGFQYTPAMPLYSKRLCYTIHHMIDTFQTIFISFYNFQDLSITR